jgi:hypothetical protein
VPVCGVEQVLIDACALVGRQIGKEAQFQVRVTGGAVVCVSSRALNVYRQDYDYQDTEADSFILRARWRRIGRSGD